MPLATLAFMKFAITQDVSVEYSIEFCPDYKRNLDSAIKLDVFLTAHHEMTIY